MSVWLGEEAPLGVGTRENLETAGDSQRKPNLNKAVLEGEMRREDTMYLLGNKQDPSSCGRKGNGRCENSAETS